MTLNTKVIMKKHGNGMTNSVELPFSFSRVDLCFNVALLKQSANDTLAVNL
jgi:hypothetical protein